MKKQTSKDESVRRQLLAIANMSRPELCEKWRDLYGNEPPNSSREFLRRRLSYRVQELFYGGLETELHAVLTSDAPKAKPKKTLLRDGAKLFRDWHGTRYEVTVRGNKYEYNGTLYRSLSGVAKAITGVLWNGKTFFGITAE